MVKWGMSKDLNKKVDIKRTREQDAWMLTKYAMREIAKIWDASVSRALDQNPDTKRQLFGLIDSIQTIFIDYCNQRAKRANLKRKFEQIYQLVLKIREK
jgi:hypothetical protein